MGMTIYGAEKDVYVVGARQLLDIGQKLELPSGDIFRYTMMGGTVGVANKLYQSSIPDGNWLTQAHTVAVLVGDTSFSFDDAGTDFTVDQMAGGTVVFEETDDLGGFYHIKSNTVTVSTETIMTLMDGVTVQVALPVAANNVMTALLNGWRETIISPASVNTAPNVGVSRVIIAADGFGWTQTRGAASCLIDSGAPAILLGNTVRASETVVGAVALSDEVAGINEYQIVGYAMETAPDADFGHLFLTVE